MIQKFLNSYELFTGFNSKMVIGFEPVRYLIFAKKNWISKVNFSQCALSDISAKKFVENRHWSERTLALAWFRNSYELFTRFNSKMIFGFEPMRYLIFAKKFELTILVTIVILSKADTTFIMAIPVREHSHMMSDF